MSALEPIDFEPKAVIGIDPSFTGFGISDGLRTEEYAASGETLRQKCASIYIAVASFVRPFEGSPMLWVVEKAMPSERNLMHLYNVGMLMSHVYDCAEACGQVAVREVPAGTLKIFVTDDGAATKTDMAIGVLQRWGVTFERDAKGNRCDAFALRQFGLAWIAGENPGVRPPKSKRAKKSA